MAHVFTTTNAKGGCGKTTVTLNLAICFARAGYRTLAIDLDQQGNLSAGLGVDLNKLSLTSHRLIINEASEIRRYLVEIRPQLHLLPNSIDIEADDLLEAKKVNRELLLRRQIKPILSDFDVIVIDTPPAMRAATVNALVVADSVIVLGTRSNSRESSAQFATAQLVVSTSPRATLSRPSNAPVPVKRSLSTMIFTAN